MAEEALELKIEGTDEASAPLHGVRDALDEVAKHGHGGGASGAFREVGENAETAGKKAEESEGFFARFKETLGDVVKTAAGFALGNLTTDLAEHFKTTLESVTELGHATHDLQMETGATAEQASGMLAVFERWGVTNDQAAVSLANFARNINTYNDESAKAEDRTTGLSGAVQSLGLTFKNADGSSVSLNEALFQVADKFSQIPDGIQKTADAMALFGRAGRDMIPILDQGRQGLQTAIDTAQQYGLVLTEDNVMAVYKFGQAQRDLSEAVKGFAVQVGAIVLPALTSLVTTVSDAAASFNTTVLPILKDVVEYVSTTFGPYIAAGAQIAGDAFNALVSVGGSALNGLLSIVESVGQAIYDALSWINPFAEHSPSLVSQVNDGVQQITASYGDLVQINGPLGDAGQSVQDFAAKGKESLQKLTDSTKIALDEVTSSLNDAKTALSTWGSTPIQGTKAFQDQLDAIDDKTTRLKIKLDDLKMGGTSTKAQQDAIKGVENEIANLGYQADKLKLNEKLQLDPLKKQIADAIKPPTAEKPFAEILKGVTDAQTKIATLTPEQKKLTDALKLQSQAMSEISQAAAKTAGANKALGGSLQSFAEPLKDVNKGVDEAKAKFAEWSGKVQEARAKIDGFVDSIKNGFGTLASSPIGSALSSIFGSDLDIGKQLLSAIQGHGIDTGAIGADISNVLTQDGKIISTVATALYNLFSRAINEIPWDKVWTELGNAKTAIVAKVSEWATAFSGWAGPAIDQFIKDWPKIENRILDTIAALVKPIGEQIGKWADAFAGWAGPIIAEFLKDWPKLESQILDKLHDLTEAFVAWIGPALPGILSALADVALAIGFFVLETAAVLAGKLLKWGIELVAWIIPQIGPALIDLGIFVATLVSWILTGGEPQFKKSGSGLGTALVDGVIQGLKDLGPQIKQAIEDGLRFGLELVDITVGPFHITGKGITVDFGNVTLLNGKLEGPGSASGGGGSSTNITINNTATVNGSADPSKLNAAQSDGTLKALRSQGY